MNWRHNCNVWSAKNHWASLVRWSVSGKASNLPSLTMLTMSIRWIFWQHTDEAFIFPVIMLTLYTMYVIKVKGVAKIPDYVQLRDDAFTLLAYFRVDRPDKALQKIGLQDQMTYIMSVVEEIPFGQIKKLDLS